ncbi:hypothetical protein CEQ21_22110 [Niallia circulans]|uniref:Uncharacterized protein n=1 Tax=Niallia circulans TaxID=1397 RepID=A0A553SM94_NIACI|nr:hypothetical protein [Niallia circulans]TRZ38109.1 hypothetical protein CEQ21_22110 [Niallia circulans]
MKQYRYTSSVLFLSIILPVLIMMGLFIWAIVQVLNGGLVGIHPLLLIAMPVLFITSVIGINNPSSITLTTESIIFEGFWSRHEYKWEDVKELTLKDYGYVGKAFIKIGRFRLLGGRYWVSSKLEGYKELLAVIKEIVEGRERHAGRETAQSK